MVVIEHLDLTPWMNPEDRPMPADNKMPIAMYIHLIRKARGRYQWQYEYNIKQLLKFTGSKRGRRRNGKNAKIKWKSSCFDLKLPPSNEKLNMKKTKPKTFNVRKSIPTYPPPAPPSFPPPPSCNERKIRSCRLVRRTRFVDLDSD